MIKVLIADDHAIVRRGLTQIAGEVPDITIAGEATNAREVLELVGKRHFDVLVLDITMPGRSGLDILQEIKRLNPRIQILVLSMHSEDQFATRVFRAGAAGYLPKESAPDELVKAIRKVHSGGKYISQTQAEKLVQNFDGHSDQPPHDQLSNREFDVLRRIASGRTVSQIASELNLSVKTVSTYRSRILEKMRMQTSAELTHYAIRNSLVE
jgi:DNA-binding NarL/FixJ family response regulator